MTATATRIPEEVCEALRSGDWEDLYFTMPPMEYKLYAKVKKVMENFGGKWNRKAQAIIFEDQDRADSMMEAAQTGEYVDLKKAYQFFETPPDVVDRMIGELGHPLEGLRILEPSAGCGAIAFRLVDLGAEVHGVELNPEMAKQIKEFGNLKSMFCRDFLDMPPTGEFDYVAMNPPFSNLQYIDHIRHAFKFLKVGGRLVAIAPPSYVFRQDRKTREFRDWLDEQTLVYDFDIPEGAFKSSGTDIRTNCLVIDK